MESATLAEYFILVISSLTLIIILITSFMCVQLYRLYKPAKSDISSIKRICKKKITVT